MAIVTRNTPIGKGSFVLELTGLTPGRAGQFYMVRIPGDNSKILPRPISIFDTDAKKNTVMLYVDIAGKGTAILSEAKAGDELAVTGPFGNGFALHDGDVSLVGGSCGAAPLSLLAKTLLRQNKNRAVTTYLGFSSQCSSLEFFKEIFSSYGAVVVDVGGYITDKVDFSKKDVFYICGPTPMMKAAARKSVEYGAKTYVSLEKRMACGVGACFACSCQTTLGNKRVCRDGPVFPAEEVLFD